MALKPHVKKEQERWNKLSSAERAQYVQKTLYGIEIVVKAIEAGDIELGLSLIHI